MTIKICGNVTSALELEKNLNKIGGIFVKRSGNVVQYVENYRIENV